MGGQCEGMHLVSERTDEHISSQAIEDRGIEKAMPEEELSITSSDGKGCFACNERSHNLEQCKTKYELVSAARQFGYATKFAFTVIQPSDEMVEKKKFYHHCVLIKSNVTNLDKSILKDELKKFWKLSSNWELRRECSTTFLASFSSEDDVTSCLKNPEIETLLDNKEVKLTVTRWNKSDDGSPDLVEDWLLVSGVPRIYRNWKELYEVASAFGVLIDIDEESLDVGDKEPIRLKTTFRSFDGASFSYYFAFGWSSKLVMVTAVQDKTQGLKHKNKELDDREHKKELNTTKSILLEETKGIEEPRSNGKAKENEIGAPAVTVTNSEVTAAESSKPEAVQSIAQSPRSMTGEEHFRGIQKPPIKHVFKRRGKKQPGTEEINKSPSNKIDKEVAPHSSSNATRTRASTGCDMLDQKDCTKMEPKKELNMEEITPVGESKKAEKLGACRDPEYNNVAASTINSKKTQILGDTSRTPRDELITKYTKGVGMDQMGSGVQVHKKEDASKIDTRLLPNSEEVSVYDSFSEMGLHENLLKGIYQYGLEKPSAVHQSGIVPLCKGFDVLHRSLSGTTETICSGVLQRLDYGSAECQALIIVPTPDLAQETEKVLEALGQFLGVTAQTCTGGTSAHADQQTLPGRAHVLVGTPDCILDMLQRHALCPDHIRMLFLDEADELLTGGSKDQIYNIVLHLPNKIQVGLFSATYSTEAMETSRRFMDKPVAVIVPRDEELKNVKQYYLAVENEELKLGKLFVLFKTTGVEQLVIFANTRDKVLSLAEDVGRRYAVSASHDGMDQRARDAAIQKFRSESSSILIATDHGGTTNAMPQVPIIINYDLPAESMRYVRRLQQQNRQFRRPVSVAISLVTPADRRTLSAITSFCKSYMGELPTDLK